MKLGFICINVPGHVNPMTALARQLQARNHDVVFLYSSGAAGLSFVPGPEKDPVNENISEVSKMQGDDVLEVSVRLVLAQTETILKSLPAIVAANGVEALVLDAVQYYAELGRCSWACRTSTCQTPCTMTTLVTLPSLFMVGPMRLPLKPWLETGGRQKV